MTEDKSFKRRVRERMSKTGESYATARSHVAEKRDRNRAARTRLTVTEDRVSDEAIRKSTGKTWDEWFPILDTWGAREKTHTEIARYVSEEHGVPGWWSQSVTVAYEQARGMRLKYERPDGFSITASKTIAVPAHVLFDAFVDDVRRKEWLTRGRCRSEQRSPVGRLVSTGRTARRGVNVGFTEKGPSKSSVAVAHERLPDADEAETAKARWKARLIELQGAPES
jgi:hypothetical protein